MDGDSPVSVCEVPGAATSLTAVPLVGVVGAVGPWARRMTTPAKSAAPGLVQVRFTVVAVLVAPTPVTGPGGVVSGGSDVVPVVVGAGRVVGHLVVGEHGVGVLRARAQPAVGVAGARLLDDQRAGGRRGRRRAAGSAADHHAGQVAVAGVGPRQRDRRRGRAGDRQTRHRVRAGSCPGARVCVVPVVVAPAE